MTKHLTARLRFYIDAEEEAEAMLYCEVKEGKRYRPIAKRASGKGWISLEPGWTVTGGEPGTDYSTINIHYEPVEAH
jgi:hypothetical protein